MSTETFVSGVVPGGWPGLGHAWPLFRAPLPFLSSLSRYGDVVEIHLGTTRAVVPCHPEVLRRTLTNDRLFDKGGKYYDRAKAMAGNGVATCPHRDHRQQRRMLQPAFQESHLERYAGIMEQEIGELSHSWGGSQDIDVYPVLYGLALRTVTRALFSSGVDEDAVAGIRHSFDTAFSGFFRQLFLPQAFVRLPLPGNVRTRRALSQLRQAVQHVITDSLSHDGADNGADDGRYSILAALRAACQEQGVHIDDEEMYDQAVTMLSGGSETVASALTWALYLLSQDDRAQSRLQQEADSVLAGPVARWSEVPRLSYAQRVVTEALRLYPPAWFFTRVTTADTELAGRRLTAGTTVVISAVPVHRNPRIFAEADRFDPDRWLPERAAGLPRGAFAGFGGGARTCMGVRYAMTECALVLGTIARQWNVAAVPDHDARPVPLAVFCRPRRLQLRLHRRGR